MLVFGLRLVRQMLLTRKSEATFSTTSECLLHHKLEMRCMLSDSSVLQREKTFTIMLSKITPLDQLRLESIYILIETVSLPETMSFVRKVQSNLEERGFSLMISLEMKQYPSTL